MNATEVRSSGKVYLLSDEDGELVVRTRHGETLDPGAADVLIALGGDEPSWLRLVDGLYAAHALSEGDLAVLVPVADALGRKATARAQIARTSKDPLVVAGLAGLGQPHVAQNPLLTPAVWDALVGSRNTLAARKGLDLAGAFPPSMAAHPDEQVRERAALNPVCPPDVLSGLAVDSAIEVRVAVAGNPSTLPGTLVNLAKSREPQLKRDVGSNPHTPVRSLQRLSHAREGWVRAAVAGNVSFPSGRALRLLPDRDGRVHQALAQRADLGPLALAWVERFGRRAEPRSWRTTRYWLGQNRRSPDSLHRRLERIARAHDCGAPAGPTSFRPNFLSFVFHIVSLFILSTAAAMFLTAAFAEPQDAVWALPVGLLPLGAITFLVRRRLRRLGAVFLLVPPGRKDLAVIVPLLLLTGVLAWISVAGALQWLAALSGIGIWRYHVPSLAPAPNREISSFRWSLFVWMLIWGMTAIGVGQLGFRDHPLPALILVWVLNGVPASDWLLARFDGKALAAAPDGTLLVSGGNLLTQTTGRLSRFADWLNYWRWGWMSGGYKGGKVSIGRGGVVFQPGAWSGRGMDRLECPWADVAAVAMVKVPMKFNASRLDISRRDGTQLSIQVRGSEKLRAALVQLRKEHLVPY